MEQLELPFESKTAQRPYALATEQQLVQLVYKLEQIGKQLADIQQRQQSIEDQLSELDTRITELLDR